MMQSNSKLIPLPKNLIFFVLLICGSVSVKGEIFGSSPSTLQSLDVTSNKKRNNPVPIHDRISISYHQRQTRIKKSWFQKLRGGDSNVNDSSNEDTDLENNRVGLSDAAVESSVIIKNSELTSLQQQKECVKGVEDEKNKDLVTVSLDENFPSPLRNRVKCISLPKFNVDIFILGTAHISRDSAQDASWIMQHLRPDCLFVELCHQRTGLLLPPSLQNQQSSTKKKSSVKKDANDDAKHEKTRSDNFPRTAALSSVLLTKIQSDYATKLNVTIGGEFHAAYECAFQQQKEYERMMHWDYYYRQSSSSFGGVHNTHDQGKKNKNGCVVVLGDRPVKLTLLRAWESLQIWGKIKLVLALLWSSLRQPSMEELKKWMDTIMNDTNSDLLTKSIEEMKTHFPSMERVIIQERDEYMTLKLFQTARILSSYYDSSSPHKNNGIMSKRKTIVAVVGAGHCGGMLQRFGDILSSEFKTKEEEELAHQQSLASLVETKRYKVDNNEFVKSLTTDITQLQYPK